MGRQLPRQTSQCERSSKYWHHTIKSAGKAATKFCTFVKLSLRALSRQESSSHGTSNTICASIICQSRSRRDKEHWEMASHVGSGKIAQIWVKNGLFQKLQCNLLIIPLWAPTRAVIVSWGCTKSNLRHRLASRNLTPTMEMRCFRKSPSSISARWEVS